MAAGLDFAGMVPGFDFLQNLMKGAGSALPAMGQWVAPTLDPAELDKRIGELRTVQFWLEQNAKLLGATIQAMEVQRMTLATLQTMNLPMADLREALTIKPPAPAPTPQTPPPPAPEPAPAPEAAAPAAAIDPMKWWGALTQQFTEIASQAIQASGADAQAAASPRPRQAVTGVKELPAKRAAAKKMTLKKTTAKKATSPASAPALKPARKSRA